MTDLELAVLDPHNLDRVLPWFDDDATRRALGDRDWVRRALRLMETQPGTYDGHRRVEDRIVWVAYDMDEPVGLIDVETYNDSSAVFALVVSPTRREQGLCPRVLKTAMDHPRVRSVRRWLSTVDIDNHPSIRCMTAAGFTPFSQQPDPESALHLMLIRPSD